MEKIKNEVREICSMVGRDIEEAVGLIFDNKKPGRFPEKLSKVAERLPYGRLFCKIEVVEAVIQMIADCEGIKSRYLQNLLSEEDYAKLAGLNEDPSNIGWILGGDSFEFDRILSVGTVKKVINKDPLEGWRDLSLRSICNIVGSYPTILLRNGGWISVISNEGKIFVRYDEVSERIKQKLNR